MQTANCFTMWQKLKQHRRVTVPIILLFTIVAWWCRQGSSPATAVLNISETEEDLIMSDPYNIKSLPSSSSIDKSSSSHQHLSMKHCRQSSSYPKLVTIASVENNMLSHVGGTGHWYHFMQRILPSLQEAEENVWGDKKYLSTSFTDDIYILFAEESSVSALQAFGRFTLTSLLTAGRFTRVHIGYSPKLDQIPPVLSSSQSSSQKQAQVVYLDQMRVLFTVDFSRDSPAALFVHQQANTSSLHHDHHCFEQMLHVPLTAPRRKFQWFLSQEKYQSFQRAVQMTCDYKNHHRNNVEREEDAALSALPGVQVITKDNLDELLMTTSTEEKALDENDRRTKKRFLLRRSNMKNLYQQTPFVGFAAAAAAALTAVTSSSNAEDEEVTTGHHSPHPHVRRATAATNGNNHYDHDMAVTNGEEDDIVEVVKSGHLDKDPSVFNSFKAGKVLKPARISSPSQPSAFGHDEALERRTIVIYQRDSTRKFLNLPTVLQTLVSQLPEQRWRIIVITHSNFRSPCVLTNLLANTDVMLTVHGFQSILSLFQKKESSLLAEVHPHLMHIPYFFGELFLALRQHLDINKQFLSEESIATGALIKFTKSVGLVTEKSCVEWKFCRHLAKAQDVIISPQFLRRLIAYMKIHFL